MFILIVTGRKRPKRVSFNLESTLLYISSLINLYAVRNICVLRGLINHKEGVKKFCRKRFWGVLDEYKMIVVEKIVNSMITTKNLKLGNRGG
jgi:hypothetical protein